MKQRIIKQRYVIVRCHDAGVHAGYLVNHKGREVELKNSRRIWYWKGAASLSELALRGAREPHACKFSVSLERVLLLEACEILFCSKEAQKMIESCPEWRA